MSHRTTALILLALASPAAATDSVQVPEASGLTLFALGVLGVLVGRHFSMRRRESDSED